jgi:hypothetical protein
MGYGKKYKATRSVLIKKQDPIRADKGKYLT